MNIQFSFSNKAAVVTGGAQGIGFQIALQFLQSGAKVSRYEQFVRVPSLETALACEVIFQRSASELFGGLYQKVERQVAERAKALHKRTEQSELARPAAQKRQVLNHLAALHTQ